MENKIGYLGLVYKPGEEEKQIELSKVGLDSAANLFQWNVLHGMLENGVEQIRLINCVPVGVWPIQYKKLILKNKKWNYKNIECSEVGCINLPVIKQNKRFRTILKLLNKNFSDGDKIIIYSAYYPFLKALYFSKIRLDATLIVTDLPEYYDLGGANIIRTTLRKIQNKKIYKYMKRVNRFVLLTDKMCEPLHVENRPFIVLEGICKQNATEMIEKKEKGKKIILYTGTLHYQYGIKNLLEAFKELNVENTELWICGKGEAESEIINMAQEDHKIKYLGFRSQSEIQELQGRATVLVNPRTNQGEFTKYSFPSKTMEYMASSTPVVMYKLDGVPKEYYDYLFFPDDESSKALCIKLKEILSMDSDELTKFGKRAAEFVMTHKNRKYQVGRLLSLLEK